LRQTGRPVARLARPRRYCKPSVSSRLLAWVHEYDCFNATRPLCDKGRFLFHDECIGDKAVVADNRPFDTLANQIARNGDRGKRLIVKMDVEGAEWASLLATPDEVLDRIDQLVIEIHGTDEPRFLQTIGKLKRLFHVAHFHANNATCDPSFTPLTSWANEVLFVNKRLGILDPAGGLPTLPSPLDAPNHPQYRDCQPRF
jgi:hypothetical protein